jgi:predicted HTH transcriptional regulator
MKLHYIHKLIAQGEHQQLDFKFEIADSRKIARTFSAFANTDGGKLLIGVKDDGTIAGIRTEEEEFMAETAVNLYCKPLIEFNNKEWIVEGKKVLEITIKPGNDKPYYAQDINGKWLAYIRIGDRNMLAGKVIVRAWKRKKQPEGTYLNYGINEKLILQYLEKNELITLSKFSRMACISSWSAEKILINLLALEILEAVFDENQISFRLSEKFRENEQ